jgi:AraC family transcriptional regulator of adaptative response/methylated-DNA-[protein]-cysteine methyltransferase
MVQETVYIKKLETPLGVLIAGATNSGICLLEFTDRMEIESEYEILKKLLNAEIIHAESPFFAPLEMQLKEYFAVSRKVFELPLLYTGTPFQQAVWKELQTIPYGATRSYIQQAKALKNPEGVRAVAHANGTNSIAILIPCHRVIGKNGSLTGYGGGLWRKKWLLDLEAKNSGQPVLGLFGDTQIKPETLITGKAVGLPH